MDSFKTKKISVYNADCRQRFGFIESNCIDLIIADPPSFLQGYDAKKTKPIPESAKPKVVTGLPVSMKFHPNQGSRLQSFFSSIASESIRILKPGGFMLVFGMGRLLHRIAVVTEDAGFEIRDMLIWTHQGDQGKAFSQNHFVRKLDISERKKIKLISDMQGRTTPQLRPKFQPILLAQKPKQGTFIENWQKWKTGLIQIAFEDEFNKLRQQTNLLEYKKQKRQKHFNYITTKPLNLLERMIEIFSIENQLVLDPFLGSGTTLIACLKKNRRCIGFEKETHYYQLILDRIKKFNESQNKKSQQTESLLPGFS